jgi:hypothetical protein
VHVTKSITTAFLRETIEYVSVLQTLVWKTFAKLQAKSYEDLSVVIENIQFHRATIMPKEGEHDA